jgi:ADP-heptose:LPS heptosyltransferase
LSPAAFFEKTIKRIFWKSLSPQANPSIGFCFKPGMSVLALRPDRLGDFILSAPALQALERKLGHRGRLTLVAGERNEVIARFFFPRAEILVFRKFFPSRLILFLRLWLRHFDLTLDFHSYPFSTTSALMTLCSGSPYRVGFWDRGESMGISRKIFNLGAPPPSENLHEMEKSFLLLKAIGLGPHKSRDISFEMPEIPVRVRKQVKAFYERTGVGDRTFVLAIHPTLQKEDNRWSIEKYRELLQKAGLLPNLKVVVVHGLGEGDRLQRFKELLGGISNLFILPDNDVLFILEAAKRFNLLVCNDSGLMHLAALVTKVLAVFGPSDPDQWSPLKIEQFQPKVFRSRDRQCDSVRVSEVFGKVKKIFIQKRSNF